MSIERVAESWWCHSHLWMSKRAKLASPSLVTVLWRCQKKHVNAVTMLRVFDFRHQLQCPGQYSPLEAFYEDKKAVLPPGGNGLVTVCPTSTMVNRCMHPEMKVSAGETLHYSNITSLTCFFIIILWGLFLLCIAFKYYTWLRFDLLLTVLFVKTNSGSQKLPLYLCLFVFCILLKYWSILLLC